jgi:hypothetical protein
MMTEPIAPRIHDAERTMPGASRGLVVRMVLGHAALLVTLGFVIGSVAARNLQVTASAFLSSRGAQGRVKGPVGR